MLDTPFNFADTIRHVDSGLRDVFSSDPAILAMNLRGCTFENSWPDWLAFVNRYTDECPTGDIDALLESAIKSARWPQTREDIIVEMHCRQNGNFVVQKSRKPLTIESGELSLCQP